MSEIGSIIRTSVALRREYERWVNSEERHIPDLNNIIDDTILQEHTSMRNRVPEIPNPKGDQYDDQYDDD